MTTLSFEFFPTKTDEGTEKLLKVRDELAAFNPEFFSVTYGAGGSTRDRTYAIVKAIQERGIAAAPHLSCVGDSTADLRSILKEYQDLGIDRIVALRGDLPSGSVSCASPTNLLSSFAMRLAITSNLKSRLTLRCTRKQQILSKTCRISSIK